MEQGDSPGLAQGRHFGQTLCGSHVDRNLLHFVQRSLGSMSDISA